MTTTFAERLPFPFTLRESTLADSPLDRNGREIHYTIAGVPFRVQVTPDMPLTIQSAPVQKDQQDVEPEAGENSLSGWWIRNQSSWHEGAGARFAEPRGEVKDTFQFWQSSNIDVWTPGQLTMLRRSATVTDGAIKSVAAIPDPSVNAVLVGRSGNIAKYDNLDAGTASTTFWTETGGVFNHVIAGDSKWWAILDVSGLSVRVFTSTYSTATPEAWQLTGGDPAKPMRVLFAKHRLWACNGNKIWQINVAGGTPGAPVSVSAIWTHPSSSFVFTDLCDAPGGILVSGYGDGSSSLQQITLDAAGALPTITGARVTAVLPNDEKILRISSLASSQVLMLTNRGVRLAVAQTNGEMVYGPRFMDRAEVPSTAKPQVVSAGRWWWLVWGDETKVWRIDSSVEIDDGVLAFAQDMQSGATNFAGITVRNERPIVVDTAGSLAYRHATELEAAGSLTGSRIRYRTDEPKTFQRVATTIAPLAGTLEVVVLNDADSERPLITYNEQGKTNIAVAELPNEANPNRFASVKLNFTRKATDATQGPTVYGVQVKALPASKPQRVYQIPLMCYDREKWSTDQTEGYDGFARDRYEALKMAENAGSPVKLVDYTVEPTQGELVRIEELRMIRHTQPHATNQVGSWGGILVATLRTLT